MKSKLKLLGVFLAGIIVHSIATARPPATPPAVKGTSTQIVAVTATAAPVTPPTATNTASHASSSVTLTATSPTKTLTPTSSPSPTLTVMPITPTLTPTRIPPTPTVYIPPTTVPARTLQFAAPAVVGSSGSSGGYTCAGKTKCGQMESCAEARYYLTQCGISRLDGDHDGTPCESMCGN